MGSVNPDFHPSSVRTCPYLSSQTELGVPFSQILNLLILFQTFQNVPENSEVPLLKAAEKYTERCGYSMS